MLIAVSISQAMKPGRFLWSIASRHDKL
jgi:hypothetical protein